MLKKIIIRQVVLPFIVGLTILFLTQKIWCFAFLQHIKATGYIGDIFRPTMQHQFAPLYQFYDYEAFGAWGTVCSVAVLLLLFLVYKIVQGSAAVYILGEQRTIYGIALLQILLTILFGFTDGSDRWLILTQHYEGFALGLPACNNSFAQMLQGYSSIMTAPNLGAHLNHYPPGNLTLLLLSQKLGGLWFAKIMVLTAAVATLWQMRRIAVYLGIKNDIAHLILLFYATNTGILIFPSLDFAAFLPLLSTWVIAAFLKIWLRQSSNFNTELGVAISIFIFFSFNIAVVLCFILLWLCWEIRYLFVVKNADFGTNTSIFIQKIRPAFFVNAVFVLIFYFILYKTTHFDIIQCLRVGLANNSKLMNYDAFDNFTRYMLRSTGNLLAYCIGSFGLVPTLLLALSIPITQKNTGNTAKKWLYACLSFCCFATFSTLFVGETERVWLYFTPLLLLALAPLLTAWQTHFGWRLLAVLLCANGLLALCAELLFHYVC